MPIHVTSEISPLKKVLLHRPGAELEHLAPAELKQLLFEDIPFLRTAQAEHDCFAEILRAHGVEVVYLEDLMCEVLRMDPAIKEAFVRQFVSEGGVTAQRFAEALVAYLMSIEDEKALVLKTMSGVTLKEVPNEIHSPLVDQLHSRKSFLLDPIPNLYFTRDPFASIGQGASLHRMFSATRRRETVYAQYILQYHPDFAKETPLYYERDFPFSMEGGDILNLSKEVLAVGISQRTAPEAIELLSQNLFADENCAVRKVLAIDIPGVRSFMHLDTVFSQLDRDKFTVHPGVLRELRLFEITPGKTAGTLAVREHEGNLASALSAALGLSGVTLVKCGGGDKIASEREQWNDGSNTLCIRPGTVVVYDRNYVTNEALRKNGIEVIEMPSSELSRGRGGPRCMSMPLVRGD